MIARLDRAGLDRGEEPRYPEGADGETWRKLVRDAGFQQATKIKTRKGSPGVFATLDAARRKRSDWYSRTT